MTPPFAKYKILVACLVIVFTAGYLGYRRIRTGVWL